MSNIIPEVINVQKIFETLKFLQSLEQERATAEDKITRLKPRDAEEFAKYEKERQKEAKQTIDEMEYKQFILHTYKTILK